jgi:photosystem II stability/assembly factor-like uncharacterized protein
MATPQEGWAVGTYGTILHYSHGTWQTSSSPTGNTLNSVSSLSGQEAWAVGDQGTILHYRDGIWNTVQWMDTTHLNYSGDIWNTVQWTGISRLNSSNPYYQTKRLLAVVMTSERAGWIVGDGYLLHYNQEVWQVQSTNSPQLSFEAFALSSPDEGWAVGPGSYNAIYHYQSGQWQTYHE